MAQALMWLRRLLAGGCIVLGVALFLASCQGESPTKPAPPSEPPPPASNGRRLAPVDEASKDPSFLKFRGELLQAVDRKDAPHLLSILDPQIRNSFGPGGGIDDFKEMWKPERADSEVWTELRFILTHGGAFKTEGFVAPYIFSSLPDLQGVPGYDHESYRFGAVFEDNVILRSQPDSTASPVARLSYHIVKSVDEADLPPDWMKAETTDGMQGYLPRAVWRNVIDYRAIFTKQSGTWRMVMLLAGD